MNRHALDVLQLSEALDQVARFAGSELGADAVRGLVPTAAAAAIETELDRVEETRRFLELPGEAVTPRIPDVRPPLRRLGIEGASLEAAPLRDVADLLQGASAVRRAIQPEAGGFPLLGELATRLRVPREAEERIRRAIDEHGEVRDGASRELARLRREIKGARGRLVQKLEKYMASLPARIQVADASVTVRDGRYVIPVRREGRSEVGGLVHDESATGQTLFMEPPLAIEIMNRLRELERAEVREVQRILAEVTDSLRPHRDDLAAALAALVDFDSLQARARYATAIDGHRPTLLRDGGGAFEVVNARHPLLLAAGTPVVPFDLRLDPGERALLVSGPNTGGKTVLLKAVGLLSGLTQAGVIAPLGPGTRLPVFADVFADIGDEQSIEASLSTFSAHLRNQREVLEQAGADSLVLMDEMGSGTDPVEGAALARSILLELVGRGALTFATTHLGELKALAAGTPAVVNASLQFDAVELKPTYRLAKGVPGRSYGLAIARRLGLPAGVLTRAESLVPRAERDLAALLDEMEEKDRRLQEALVAAESGKAEAERLRSLSEERDQALRVRERSAERLARQQARDLLLAAREEVEAVIGDLRAAAARDAQALESAARESRRRLEESAREQADRMPAPREGRVAAGPLEVGGRVRVTETGAIGTLVELREGRAVVELGGLRLQVPAAGLAPESAGAQATAPSLRGSGWSAPDFDASPDVDLRGYRADEVAGRLQPAIDAAVQAALPSLRIIHGKGTGALRQVVADLLRSDGRVASFRPGGIGEGGSGVTVAELR
jgi:DNA mismatch repair protein MutS2